jgi:hypothetical protein
MAQYDGTAALKLDFGGVTTVRELRLMKPRRLHGPDKYKVLEHRRRQAQIKARRLLDLLEEAQ